MFVYTGGLCLLAMLAAVPMVARPPDEAAMERSLVSPGDTARLQRVLARARRGEKVTVGVIGGSITAGASATTVERRWGNRVAAWWRERFPRVEFVNAGIGATGSDYGALRARRDLLGRRPDFVVAEYGVNDGNTREFAETLEGLLRQILSQPQRPAVMLLFMMHRNGGNAQEWQGKVGRHYGLPMVSYRDALWPEIEAGRLKWEDVMADEVHPNDAGHEYAARFVTRVLDRTLAAMPADRRLPRVAPLPTPLISDLFEHVALFEAPDLTPRQSEGWTLDRTDKCWRSDRPGSVLEVEVPGRALCLLTWRIRGPMGRARVQVDDRSPVDIEGWFDATWGGYQPLTVVARELPPGRHRVRVEVLPERAAGSTGHEFKVFAIGCAGAGREERR